MSPRSSLGFRTGRLFYFAVSLAVILGAAAQASASSTTTLAITAGGKSVTKVAKGTAVTLTATVTSSSAAVTAGTVFFCDANAKSCNDIHQIGTSQLASGGTAAFEFVPAPGAHSYKAEFIGTSTPSQVAASSSSAVALQVSGGPTTTTIAQSGSAGNYTLTATVSGASASVAPSGTVNFLDTSSSNSVVATAALGSGKSGALAWAASQTSGLGASAKNYPYSVAVGDFNDDGIPDLVFGSDGYISIVLGNGDGTFQDAKYYAALANNQYIAVAKFVNGGPDDVIVVSNTASTTANNFQLFIGNGMGGMTAQPAVALGGLAAISGLAVGDLAYDGNQSFVVFGTTFGVYCFAPVLGNGNGTFGGPTLNAIGGDAGVVVVADFNNDDYPDVVVANDSTGVQGFQNDSMGNFFPEGNGTTPIANPTSAVVGDFNSDGNRDIALTDAGTNTVQIYLGDGNFNFTLKSSPSTGASPSSIAVGDFNGDGIADLAVTNSGVTGSSGAVTILLGKGDGTFTTAAALSGGPSATAVASGNFNGVDTSDLAIASSAVDTATIQLAQVTRTATATASGVTVPGSGGQLVDASYPGDSTYAASVSGTVSVTGSSNGTATVLAASPNPAGVGQTVTLTATVKKDSGSGSPTGKVTFSVQGQTIGSGNLNSGVATLSASTNGLTPGSYPVVASYGGDSGDAASKSPALTVTLDKAATTTTLTASPTTVTPPAKVTLTATVARSASGDAGVPTGSITFYADSSTALGTVKLNSSGVASVSAPSSGYPANTYAITAKYSGDSADSTSTSTAVNVTVK